MRTLAFSLALLLATVALWGLDRIAGYAAAHPANVPASITASAGHPGRLVQ